MCYDFLVCNCDFEGSVSLQCDINGNCLCRFNIEGQYCDRCMENKYNIIVGCIGKQNYSCMNVQFVYYMNYQNNKLFNLI